jgi:hypothetical protein
MTKKGLFDKMLQGKALKNGATIHRAVPKRSALDGVLYQPNACRSKITQI